MIKKFFKKVFKPRAIQSFKKGMDLTDLPIVSFYQGDVKLNFILDTGASYNVLDAKILSRIEHTKRAYDVSVYGLAGKIQSEVCSVNLEYQGKKYKTEFAVNSEEQSVFDVFKTRDGLDVHGLIGSAFFHEYHYIIDFDKLIAYSKL